MKPRQFRYYDLLVHVFVVLLLISNLVGQKITKIGPVTVGGAQLLFPLTYIFGDVFTEVYGYAGSRRAIWIGFFASALLSLMCIFMVWLPPAPGWPNQEAYRTVFYQVPRMVVASLIAYWCGEFANSFVLAKMKLWTKGKYLWTRTIGSTVVGQGVDSMIFYPLAFVGAAGWTNDLVVKVLFTQWALKVAWEALLTPVTYAVVGFLKRREGIDVYDAGTDFTPFRARL